MKRLAASGFDVGGIRRPRLLDDVARPVMEREFQDVLLRGATINAGRDPCSVEPLRSCDTRVQSEIAGFITLVLLAIVWTENPGRQLFVVSTFAVAGAAALALTRPIVLPKIPTWAGLPALRSGFFAESSQPLTTL